MKIKPALIMIKRLVFSLVYAVFTLHKNLILVNRGPICSRKNIEAHRQAFDKQYVIASSPINYMYTPYLCGGEQNVQFWGLLPV